MSLGDWSGGYIFDSPPRIGASAAKLLILCYHAVSESWPVVGSVTPTALDKQLRYLLRRGYRPRTLAEALLEPVRDRTLVVTFDDAFRSVLDRGLPVLSRLEIPATIFVPTDFAADASLMTWSTLRRWVGTPHEEELRCLGWEGLRELVGAGWEVGSHTASHPRLTELDSHAATKEMVVSKRACENALQRDCSSLAYPYGAWNLHLAELATEVGYSQGVTLEEQPLAPLAETSMPLALSRDGVYRWTSRLEFALATSPALRRLRTMGLYRRLRKGDAVS